jgi:NAD(P)-dependent dehydrogenase (short-subunit alcohol dehydrogenase family)
MERRFDGKAALLTGATTGIGQATAVRLAAEGTLMAVTQLPSRIPGRDTAEHFNQPHIRKTVPYRSSAALGRVWNDP